MEQQLEGSATRPAMRVSRWWIALDRVADRVKASNDYTSLLAVFNASPSPVHELLPDGFGS